jgi:hypothetical protein
MPTPHQALPFPVNPLAAALESLPEEVSDVVELRPLHAPVAKMWRVPLYITWGSSQSICFLRNGS